MGYHPHYIFAEKGDRYISLGLTTHPKQHHDVIRLSRSPNPEYSGPQYVHRRPFEEKKEFYENKRRAGWSFVPEDMPLIRRLKKMFKKRKHKQKKSKRRF